MLPGGVVREGVSSCGQRRSGHGERRRQGGGERPRGGADGAGGPRRRELRGGRGAAGRRDAGASSSCPLHLRAAGDDDFSLPEMVKREAHIWRS